MIFKSTDMLLYLLFSRYIKNNDPTDLALFEELMDLVNKEDNDRQLFIHELTTNVFETENDELIEKFKQYFMSNEKVYPWDGFVSVVHRSSKRRKNRHTQKIRK
jgi:hypothetical protein